jgi:cystathionine beta-lyase
MKGSRNAPYDFDTPIDRRGTLSTKWDKYKDRDVIPLWIADMDFRSPRAIIEALRKRVEHGVFGYGTIGPSELVDGIIAKLRARYGWKVEPEWIVFMPGVATGFSAACQAVGNDRDDVMTAVPVYHPFLLAPKRARRNLVTVPLIEQGGRWLFDFDRLEGSVTSRTSLFLLCNPHNPVGRVLTREELSRLAGICEKHGIIICSDEIHCDLLLDPEKTHVPIATLSPEVAAHTITLMSPSKTFNLAGLGLSFAIVSDPELRRRYCETMPRPGGIVPIVSVLAYTAAIVAYRDGSCDDWLAALLPYLRENREVLANAIKEIPGLSMAHVEGTFLGWIDTRNARLENPAKFFEEGGVGLSDGTPFGGEPGFVRLNFGCPRVTLEKALGRMARAMERHQRGQV